MASTVNCVCSNCLHQEPEAVIELSFRDQAIYWNCPKCKQQNILDLSDKSNKNPFPKTKTMRKS